MKIKKQVCLFLIIGSTLAPSGVFALSDSDFKLLKSNVKKHLKSSSKLRAFDENSVAKLVDYACGIDEDKSLSKVKAEFNRLKGGVQKKVKAAWAGLSKENKKLVTQLKPYKKATQYQKEASDKMTDLQKDERRMKRIMNKGSLYGSGNPKIRAAIAYGVRMHGVLEGTSKCFATEVKLSVSGRDRRADCIKISRKKNYCDVVEFKPTTYGKHRRYRKAKTQLNDYMKAVRNGKVGSSSLKKVLAANCPAQEEGKYNISGYIQYYPACKYK